MLFSQEEFEKCDDLCSQGAENLGEGEGEMDLK